MIVHKPLSRRAYPRLRAPAFFREVRLSLGGNPEELVDMSVGGFRVYSDEPLEVGRRLEIQLWVEGEEAGCEAEVVWINELPENAVARYDIGFRFYRVSPEVRTVLLQVLGGENTGEEDP